MACLFQEAGHVKLSGVAPQNEESVHQILLSSRLPSADSTALLKGPWGWLEEI